VTYRCWFCDDDVRDKDLPPGGWLLEDATWRAGAAPASYGVPGTVILESRRHVADQADFDATERATLATVTGRLLRAVREATGCARVYQWATMDRYPHFHLWLVPWPAEAGSRGPRYLVDAVVHVEPNEAATLETANRLRAALARGPETP
jgi:diadenosine tetraphosphate (Ap4A) HIT family hydrolase